jgi:hypothetical protein
VIVLTSMFLVTLCVAAALTIDFGNVTQLHRQAQTAVDDAALSAAASLARDPRPISAVPVAEQYVVQNYPDLGSPSWDSCPASPPGFSPPPGINPAENCITFDALGTAVHVTLPPQQVGLTVARAAGFTTATVEASATASVSGTVPCALCLLGPSGTTLSLSGTSSVAVTGVASVLADSNSSSAISTGGTSSSLSSQSGIYTVGSPGYKGKAGSFSPTPVGGNVVVPDPLAYLPAVTASPAAIPAANQSISTNGPLTLSPGNYGSISLSGGANLTLEPGVYVIGGGLSAGGGETITGNGVLLYFTCEASGSITPCNPGEVGASLSLQGSASVTLSPPTSGPYTGLNMFMDRNDAGSITLGGNPGLTGTIYGASGTLNMQGDAGTMDTLVVMNSVTVGGNSNVTIAYNADHNVQPPGQSDLCSPVAGNC